MSSQAGLGVDNFDVAIVGGGLAGCATALLLARSDLTCAVIEKARFPRDKPCGEGLMPHGVRRLEALGLGPALANIGARPFVGIRYAMGGDIADGDFPDRARGMGLMRRRLDATLHARVASAAHVTMVAGAAEGLTAHGVRLAGGAVVRARLIVGADGPRSVIRHAAGLDGGTERMPRFAVRQHFALASGVPLPQRVCVHVARGFELYITPVDEGVVNVAALIERATLQSTLGGPEERLAALLARVPDAMATLEGARAIDEARACGPLRVLAKAAARDSVLLVGDAAGYVDAITGEGMSLALGTAELAARAIEAALVRGQPLEATGARYRRERARMVRDHELLTHGLRFLVRHPRLARRAVARLAKEPALFSRLVAVNAGSRSLLSLGAIDALKLVVGAAPARSAAFLPSPTHSPAGR